MMKIPIGNHLTPYLILACALLTGILALQNRNINEAKEDTSADTKPGTERVSRMNFTAPGISAFAEILERPLFIEGRKPLPPAVAAAPAPARILPLRLQLEGVVITPSAKIAVLRDLNTHQILHLKTGMQHQGWELSAISETVATFKRDEQSQQLTLKK